MKFLKTCAIGVLFVTCCLHAEAQGRPPLTEPDYNKPKAFSDLPAKMNLRLTEVENLFSLPVGGTVNTKVTDNLKFNGTVVSKSDPQDNRLKTIVVKSSANPSITFTFSRIVNADGSYTYRGRIMGKNTGDGFEIVQENNTWYLQKTALYDLISE
jgi:hypothetical protein